MSNCICDLGPTVTWDAFLPYILPSIGDIPDVIAAHAAREAAIEYATVTKELRASIALQARRGASYYRLCAADDYTIESIDYIDTGAYKLSPHEFTFDQSEGRLLLNGCVSVCDGRIEVRAVVLPGQDSCSVSRMVYDRHAELISHGARMRLYRMKAEDWYDINLAREEERLFRDGMRWARVNALKGGTTRPLVMRARRVI